MGEVIPLENRRFDASLNAVLAALPPANTARWVAHRKAAVVKAIDCGALTEEEAAKRYALSAEELSSWRESLAAHGLSALRATRLQHYRNTHDG